MVTSVGVSNYGVAHLMEIEEAGLPLPAANQVCCAVIPSEPFSLSFTNARPLRPQIELHPFCQKPEILAFMKARGILPIAYSSLAQLSTWRQGGQSAKSDAARAETSPFAAIATAHGWTEAQVKQSAL